MGVQVILHDSNTKSYTHWIKSDFVLGNPYSESGCQSSNMNM